MFGRPLGIIQQSAGGGGGTGPTGVSIATSTSGNYDDACFVVRVGSAVSIFEDGSTFSGGGSASQVSAGAFNAARCRSIAFGAYARGTTSGGTLSYDWTLTEVGALPTGSLTADSENTAQDLRVIGMPSPPNGRPDTSTGIGPYVLMSSPPSLGDAGKFELDLDVTDSNGTTSATQLVINIEFIA